MGVLLITEADRRRIAAMIDRARARPVPWERMAPGAVGDDRPIMTLAERVPGLARPPSEGITLGSYTVAFSFEYQPMGLLRHLSAACTRGNQIPNGVVMDRLARAFGFRGDIARAWLEEFSPGRYAVNIVEIAEENPTLRTQQ